MLPLPRSIGSPQEQLPGRSPGSPESLPDSDDGPLVSGKAQRRETHALLMADEKRFYASQRRISPTRLVT